MTLDPELSVVVMTAYASVHSAVESMRTGATDYLTKPFALDELAQALEHAGERRNLEGASRKLRERLRSQQGLGNIIGRSPEMEKLYRILSKVAQSSDPAVIVGETGVGKELIARSIHDNGLHRSHPFLPADCASLAPALLEMSSSGMPRALLPVLPGKKRVRWPRRRAAPFCSTRSASSLSICKPNSCAPCKRRKSDPAGSVQRIPINVRILAATSQDLAEMVEQGRFRKDPYYRLNVVNLRIPPLRERKEDIPLLAAHFLDRISRETGTVYTLSDDTLRTMMEYDWPGNVRELENAVERACTLSSVQSCTWRICPRNCKISAWQSATSILRRPRRWLGRVWSRARYCLWPSLRSKRSSIPCISSMATKSRRRGCSGSARPRSIASSRNTGSATR